MLSLDIIKQQFKTGILNGSLSDPVQSRVGLPTIQPFQLNTGRVVLFLNTVRFRFSRDGWQRYRRESQMWRSLRAVSQSVSHLDSVAAHSSGSPETRALLPCQHKQLRQPLLH